MEYKKHLHGLITAAGQDLAEKIGQIDPDILVTLTAGSREHGKALKSPVRPSLSSRVASSWVNEWHEAFTKDGDGFADVWTERPTPSELEAELEKKI